MDSKVIGNTRNDNLTPNPRSPHKFESRLPKNALEVTSKRKTEGIMNLSSVIREIKREKPNIRKDRKTIEQKRSYNENKVVSDKNMNDESVPKYRPQKMLDGNEISSQELGTFMNELNIFARYKRERKVKEDRSFTSRKDSSFTLSNAIKPNVERKVSPLGKFVNPVIL